MWSAGEDIALTDVDQNGPDERWGSGFNQSEQALMLSIASVSHSFDTQEKYVHMEEHPSFVFSPLSLNAKLVGNLFESLAPAEGEVRGCFPCAYSTWVSVSVSVFFLHG